MKYRVCHKYQDSNWMPTNLFSTDLGNIIRKAQECSENAIAYGMTAVIEARWTNHHFHIVEFPAGGGKPNYIPSGYESEVLAALEQKVETKGCPDCKDGFYYPFVGPPELCRTCK